jgi:hypothetical protein
VALRRIHGYAHDLQLQRPEFEQIASSNPNLVVIKKSQLEMNGPTLWLASSVTKQPGDNWVPEEVGHVPSRQRVLAMRNFHLPMQRRPLRKAGAADTV